jgi:hypothetical protein
MYIRHAIGLSNGILWYIFHTMKTEQTCLRLSPEILQKCREERDRHPLRPSIAKIVEAALRAYFEKAEKSR